MTDIKAAEDLRYIRQVMERVRQRNLIDGIYYQIWGLAIPLMAVFTRILVNRGAVDWIAPAWGIGMACGAVVCFVIGSRRSKKDMGTKGGPETRLYYAAWISFGIASASTFVASWAFDRFDIQVSLFILALMLMTVYLIDATFSGLPWLYAVGLGWLVVGFAVLWMSETDGSLIFGLATFPLEFIPGTLLNRVYRRELGPHGRP